MKERAPLTYSKITTDVWEDRMKEAGETYLGDGLYASFDGYQIKLRAPREDEDHVVYLEPLVFRALIAFVAELPASSILGLK